MKKRLVVFAGIVMLLIVGRIGYNVYEMRSVEKFVIDFIEMSYSCNYDNVEQVLEEQKLFYDSTLRKFYEKNPPVDVHNIKETNQEMKIVSDIDTEYGKDDLHNPFIKAKFTVNYKDEEYPEGFNSDMILYVTLNKEKLGKYKIMNIGGENL